MKAPLRILSLDGGGSLGVYTLGVLFEVEQQLNAPLCEKFDVIYGTSTGSIIAALIALGESVETIKSKYFEIIPSVMTKRTSSAKSRQLHAHGKEVFGSKNFEDFRVNVGIVTTDLELNRPMIFKSDLRQLHSGKGSFVPGFGCSIRDAVIASSAAYPIFQRKELATSLGHKTLVDGGFSANNPALLAITDAVASIRADIADIRLVSVGTGRFPVRKNLLQRVGLIGTITTLLGTNANTVDGLRALLFADVPTVRIDDTFSSGKYRTNFVESNIVLLDRIFHLGRESFRKYEKDIEELFR